MYQIINTSFNALSDDERKKALKNNFDFVGKEQRLQKEWQKNYKQIYDDLSRGKYHDLIGGSNVLHLLENGYRPDDFKLINPNDPILQSFHLPPYPQAPYADFLVCWHKLWNFQGNEKQFSSLNNKNKCLFFYPHNRIGNKSFEGCEKERKALLNQFQFRATNALVIIGIFVAIIVPLLIYFLQK